MSYFNKGLSDIGFDSYEPSEELKPYIYNYWVVKKDNIPKPVTNKILSDGSSGFVMNFSNPYSIELNEKKIFCKEKIIFTGVTKHPHFVTFENNIDAIGIRFSVAGAYAFFEKDISFYTDKVTEIKDDSFWSIKKLYTKIQNEESIEKKIEYLEEFLLHQINKSKKKNAVWVFDFIDAIYNSKGNINIQELCNEFGISQRLCERKFNEQVGISPKLYSRIVRIRNVRDSLSSLDVNSLTNVSYDNGFFDQTHFIREFKSFMNETPGSYLKTKKYMAKLNNYKKY